ncbi:MAG TPA: hypothetical protein VGI82_04585 [Chitinophagaceae bacterium]|jgi:hypothetical protein
MKINKYFPFAFLYFFVNAWALPFGLTYTSLLAPFFYVWVLLKRKRETVLPFIAILSPFIIIHLLYIETVRVVYFTSLLNLILVYIFCQAVYTFLLVCNDLEKIFKKLIIINFFLCLGAMVLYFTPWWPTVWIEQNLTEGVQDFRRLKLFTYEASYYATLLVPIFCFYLLQYLFHQNTMRALFLLPMLFLPYMLSFSFGVIAVILLSWLVVYILYFRSFSKKRRIFNGLILTGCLAGITALIVFFLFRDSFFVVRMLNIISGNDSSGKGRTSDAFILAGKLLQKRDEFWGVGLGQIKIVGEVIIRKYYMYGGNFVATIPNACAETLAIFGWVGLSLRLLIEVFFFFRTRVWTNYYRLWLFLFIFIYQFTGSFITNAVEYVIWLFAFINVFSQFDVKKDRVATPLPQLRVV